MEIRANGWLLEDLRAAVVPEETEERWLQIPWIPDLWEGRRRAEAADRPIFLWAMNGHPLGCV